MREHIYGWRAASCQHVKDVVQRQFRVHSALATARDTTQRLVQRSFINENDTRALHGWKTTNRFLQTDIRQMGDWEAVILDMSDIQLSHNAQEMSSGAGRIEKQIV